MPINQIFGKTFKTIEKSLNILNKRQILINSNIANLDTPGYEAREINFREALDNAINTKTIGMFQTHPRHFAPIDEYLGNVYVDTDQTSNGVNCVDIDKEMAKLAENNLLYRTGVEVLLKKLAALKHAIIEGGK
jgi:flagellar basal-body rod protein FlgB